MYYLLTPSLLYSKHFCLFKVRDDGSYCIGRISYRAIGKCHFKDLAEMQSLSFGELEYQDDPITLEKLIATSYYSSNTYPDVANLFQTHPELFL